MPGRKRLIVRPGAIGDFVLSLPAMEHLRSDWLEIWGPSQVLPLVTFANCARSIASSGLEMLLFVPSPALVEELRGFHSIVSWYGAGHDEFRQRVTELGLPFEFLPALPPPDSVVHAADFYLTQVGGIPPAIPRIPCPHEPGDFAILHPFAGSAGKRWPLERFQELARILERRMPVQWCASPTDSLEGAVRIENLYELAKRLASARVLVGNDSGISHLAAAVGTPVVALFGPTDPRVWAPRGPMVEVITRSVMEEITVEDVAAAVPRICR
jgi:heptosyltransferase III